MDKPFVLIADDNEATCTLLIALLRNDFTVEVAHDGAEAIAKLTSRRYAAVLLDLLMPRADGYDVLDFAQAQRPDMLARILVVTASLTQRQLDRVRSYPICGVVAKPFDVEMLLKTVKACAGAGDDGLKPLLTAGVILMLAELLR